jgi:hypothetical protein
MSDLAEAGKYLFLSGVRKPDYEKAIGIFLQKYKDKPQNLFHPFPRSAKLPKISDYPDIVAKELRELGYHEELNNDVIYPSQSQGNTGKLALIIFLFVVFVIIVLIILGVIKLFEIFF